ncbi:PHP domain-containing protein [Halobacteria archaeon AArc-dxtr1]|nr:PHP domain-containing protein [Halobacteria archaeon AArc-dxtr1]
MHDYHAHTNYSDGQFLYGMVQAAEEAGLEGIGFADHCTISEREYPERERAALGFNLDLTYERRRRAIEGFRERTDLRIYDAVEVDYHPADEGTIEDFLDTAGFEYAIGSVHELDGRNVQAPSQFADESPARLDALIEEYVETLIALVDSELFAVAAHLDLFERTPPLRGRATKEQYHRIADAFERSRTIPEINAGRALHEMAVVHPDESLLAVLLDRDIEFTVGSDSHTPQEVRDRTPFLEEFATEHLERIVAPPGVAE